MNELLNKTITVSAKEEKLANGKPVMKIKDEQNLVYSVWKFKQDGTESVAWGQIPDIGDVTQIGYVEETKQTEQYGAVTYRTIRTFNKDIGQGVANKNAQSLNDKAQTPRQERFSEAKDDKFWEQQAYEKCCSLWIASMIRAVDTHQTTIKSALEAGYLWDLFQAIKTDGKKRFLQFSGTVQTAAPMQTTTPEPLPEELPTIQVEEIDVSDIPF